MTTRQIRSTARLWQIAAALLPMALGASGARGDDVAELRLRMDEQQARLDQRLGRLDEVGQVHGRYVLLRDTFLYGPAGVGELSAAWFDRAHAWVNRWQQLLAVFSEATPANLGQPSVEAGLRTTLRQQQDDWARLKTEARAVDARAAAGRAQLAQTRRSPEGYVEHYAAQLHTLNDQLDGLDAALAKAAAGFADGERAAWDGIVAETETAVTNKLARAVLQYPDLAQAVERVALFFRAERELDPQVRAVQLAEGRVRDEVLEKRLFHAADALAALRVAAAAAQTAIAAAGIDAEFAGPARAEVAAALAAGEALYDDATRSFTHGTLVAAFKVSEARRLASLCRTAGARQGLNCDLLRTLAPLAPQDIVKMTDDQLRYVEFAFDKVRAGPLP